MARNFIAPGHQVTMTAPYALTSGQGALVGALFGVAQHDALISTPVVLGMDGIYDLTKEPALAITAGARVFWDNTNRRVTTTATSNFCIGVATVAAAGGDATVRCLISDRMGPAGS
jgi:predicted RecA/RadA family phage recombinase